VKSQLRLLGGKKLQSPKGSSTRPTTARVREAVMNILGEKIEDSNWLDLCSGSGIMGCEALQRGAKRVLAVEQGQRTAKTCRSNLQSVAEDQDRTTYTEVICHEVTNFLKERCQQAKKIKDQSIRFDLVYLDPPYESEIYWPVLNQLLSGNWLKKGSLVICEYSPSIGLETPIQWIEKDRRIYGSTALLIITPQWSLLADTGSKLQQKAQEWL